MADSHTSALLMFGGVALIAVIALGLWGNAGATGAAFALKHDAQCSRWQSACDVGKVKACKAFSRKCLDVKTSAEINELAKQIVLLKRRISYLGFNQRYNINELSSHHALIQKFHNISCVAIDKDCPPGSFSFYEHNASGCPITSCAPKGDCLGPPVCPQGQTLVESTGNSDCPVYDCVCMNAYDQALSKNSYGGCA